MMHLLMVLIEWLIERPSLTRLPVASAQEKSHLISNEWAVIRIASDGSIPFKISRYVFRLAKCSCWFAWGETAQKGHSCIEEEEDKKFIGDLRGEHTGQYSNSAAASAEAFAAALTSIGHTRTVQPEPAALDRPTPCVGI